MSERTLYEVLGVAPTATAGEIKDAWRRLCREHHPDREGGDAERMAEVNAAYAVLGDRESRAVYDATGVARDPAERAAALRKDAERTVVSIVMMCVDAGVPDVIASARGAVAENLASIGGKLANAEHEVRRLEKAMRRLRRKMGPGLLHEAMGKRIADARSTVAEIMDARDLAPIMMGLLNEYEWAGEMFNLASEVRRLR